MTLMIILSLFVLYLAYVTSLLTTRNFFITCGIIILYWILNMTYCAWLKRYAIIDVCIISFGFVLRVLAGGFAIGITLSRWLVLMTFLLTLFLSLAKRRDDDDQPE